jgi:hypothetical protein
MRKGWQKVADNWRMTVYVFELHGQYEAVSQEGAGVGTLVETIKPAAAD